jgi:hypothetical protein
MSNASRLTSLYSSLTNKFLPIFSLVLVFEISKIGLAGWDVRRVMKAKIIIIIAVVMQDQIRPRIDTPR